MNETAKYIGEQIAAARRSAGYATRAGFVQGKKLRMTQEGLRKIEKGERIPTAHNLRILCRKLGIDEPHTSKLEKMALEENIKRVTRRTGNYPVSFRIAGKPVHVTPLPPKRKSEKFVRSVVEDLLKVVTQYGVSGADLDAFRKHARSILLKKLDST